MFKKSDLRFRLIFTGILTLICLYSVFPVTFHKDGDMSIANLLV